MSGFGRRELLRRLTLAGFSAATSPAWARAFASLSSADEPAPIPTGAGWCPAFLSAEQDRTVIALAEAIIPATDTPGATAAFVNRYVDAVLDDADQHVRDDFVRGLEWVDRRSQKLYGQPFAGAKREQQDALLTILSSPDNHDDADEVGRDFFEDMKAKTIVGYHVRGRHQRDELKDGGPPIAGLTPCTHPEHGAPPRRLPAHRRKRG